MELTASAETCCLGAAQLVGQRWAQLSAEQKAAWSAKAAAMRRSERGGSGGAVSSADEGADALAHFKEYRCILLCWLVFGRVACAAISVEKKIA